MPIWFSIAFLGTWLVVSGLLAILSGWASLARSYRVGMRPDGIKLTRQVTSIGLVPENGATHIIVAAEGLYLSAFPLFRFLRPPLLVPWSEVHVGGEGSRLWSRWYRLELGSAGTITIKHRAYAAIKPHLVSRTTKPNE